MRNFFRSIKGKIVIALFIVMIGFILQSAYSGTLNTFSSRAINFITKPLNTATFYLKQYINSVFDNFQRLDILSKENNELKSELTNLKNKLIEYESTKNENKALKDSLDIKEKNPDFKIVEANVIIRDTYSKFYSFSIDKGENDGIKLKDYVITKDGLVGIITQVTKDSSVVSTILDPIVNIGAFSVNSSDTGVLNGDSSLVKDNKVKFKYISKNNTIKPGDILATSGVASNSPRSINIGLVDNIYLETDGLSMTALIKPSVDIPSVNQVKVITSLENK